MYFGNKRVLAFLRNGNGGSGGGGGGEVGELTINGAVEQYQVMAGKSVSAGDFVEFFTQYGNGEFSTESMGSRFAACKLDETRVLVVHNYNASILTIADGVVTLGETYALPFTDGKDYQIDALNSNKAVLAYYGYNSGTSYYDLCGVVVEVDGTTITFGDTAVFASGTGSLSDDTQNPISVCAMSETRIVVTGYTTEAVYSWKFVSVDGNSFSVLDGGASGNLNAHVCKISRTKFALTCSPNYGVLTCYIAHIYNDDVSFVYSCNPISSNVIATAPCALTEDTVLVTGLDPALKLCASVVTIGDTGVSYKELGTFTGFSMQGGMSVVKPSKLTETTAIIIGGRDASYPRFKSVVVDIEGDGTYGNIYEMGAVPTHNIANIVISPTSVLAMRGGLGGTYRTLTIDGTTITDTTLAHGGYVQPATTRLHPVGVAKTSGEGGEMVDVYVVKVKSGSSLNGGNGGVLV